MATAAWMAEVVGAIAADSEQVQAAPVRTCPDISSAKAFLLSRPPGVYTCARVIASSDGSRLPVVPSELLVEWPFHLQRLASGVSSVDTTMQENRTQPESLQRATNELATSVLTQWQQARAASKPSDGMLSVLWWRHAASDAAPGPSGLAGYGLAVHICPMPKPKCLASTVLVYGAGRENAQCKHTKWLADRAPLERRMAQLAEHRRAPIHEVVLSKPGPGGDRLLLEGLISNFFVVKDGTLFTADEGVLAGSTRELVLKACDDLHIPTVLEEPKLSELKSWQAAFVTSSVRVVIDVTRVLWEEGEGERKVLREAPIPSDTTGFTQRLREQIAAQRMYLK